ncbi:UDP-3-O-acyl-N-acetylglucosamine deacetylase [Pseudooceanicola aestuarii]|uniref:UDP-3-O-acyl-N-acetylglucosamine deacetylase n=1 Tax=Pseudooceanicola aestuarii TaxID=2697319 RepID=UPI0013D25487|nr:UDP-3-O-acyl-N-acetylglucosamine deacetylase [Pseudooceanicola aestuarii]
MQQTLKSSVVFTGLGLHSGRSARMVIRPAAADHGIRFRRTDIALGDAVIPARWDLAERTALCTRLANGAGASVSTVEHVMAALAGCGVHNALIEIDGPEVPILDGSAAPFVRGLLACGLVRQSAPVLAIEVLRPVEVHDGAAWARLAPGKMMEITFDIDFEDSAIGHQSRHLVMKNGSFVRELCDARTFCRQADVDLMRANGLALGGSMDNAVVVEGDRVMNPEGLRHADEPVRHKMLDALGDLALAGGPILGHYTGYRAGHSLTNTLLRALFADKTNLRAIPCNPVQASGLPGVGVHLSEIPAVA